MSNTIPYKIYLSEEEIPENYYNVRADMPIKPAPLLNPGTLEPLKPEELEPVFCKELIQQELNNTDRLIHIPKAVLTASKRSSAHPRRSTISSKATTQAEATS